MIFYRSWYRPKLLSFDLDDTLYDNSQIIDYAEEYMKSYISFHYLKGDSLSEKTLSKIKSYIYKVTPNLINDVSLARYFVYKLLLEMYGYSLMEQDLIAKELLEIFFKVRSRIFVSPRNIEILRYLKNKYYLIAISNGNAQVDRTNLKGIFDRVYYPNIDIKQKPSKDLFYQACYDFNVSTCDLCHIGDNDYTDIKGAIEIGALAIKQVEYVQSYCNTLPNVEIQSLTELKLLL